MASVEGSVLPLLKKGAKTAEDYWNLPDSVRAELIDGELWDLASPIRAHQRIALSLAVKLTDYIEERGGDCEVNIAPFAVNLFTDDSCFVEPDVSVVCDHEKLSKRGCEGAPDFVCEVVSPSSVGMDYITKLSLYREAGVREYWVADPAKGLVYAYVFDSEQLLEVYDFSTPVPSRAIPGFTFDFGAVMNGM